MYQIPASMTIEYAEWWNSKSYGQEFNVRVETSEEWHSLGVDVEMGNV